MFNAPLRPQLYQLHTALTQNAPLDQQDALIMALCDELAARREELLPPPLYIARSASRFRCAVQITFPI